MTRHFDAIVIGSGQAGPFLAARLVAAGKTVALMEREHLGGTCVNDGCMPTKTLVASARAAHMARRAADFGVLLAGDVQIDMHKVKARVQGVVQQSVRNLSTWLEGMQGLTLVWGHARFTGPHSVQVGSEQFTAPQIFINVGGRPVIPDWPGLADVPYLTNTSVLALDTVPQHLLIAGGSYIGLEFAQIYRRFGAQVTVVEYADRLIAREDEAVSQAVRELLEAEGIRFITGARDMRVERRPDGRIAMSLQAQAQALALDCSHLLIATGRRPNTDDLGLEQAGITTDARGFIVVDEQLRSSVDGIWCLGDANGQGAFTHTSYNDFEIVAANLLDGDNRRRSDRIPAYALFTDPPLARIGMDIGQARQSGRKVLMGTLAMSRVGRARERDETQGFMQVLVDADTQRILGATLLGIEADEVVHALLNIMAADQPYTVIQRCVPIHPTVSELIPTLLGTLTPLH